MAMTDPNYESMVSALLTLIDEIEIEATDDPEAPYKIRELCQQRFDIAEEYGLTLFFEGEQASAEKH